MAYVKLAKHGEHTDDIVAIVNDVIKNQERFAQLGAGWVLRELWLAEPQLVVDFITERYHLFTREGLRYAIEKMDSGLQQTLLKYDPTTRKNVIVKSSSTRTPIAPSEDDEEFTVASKSTKKKVKMAVEAEDAPKITKKRASKDTSLETKPRAKRVKEL